jgi:hypothetical protein
MTRRGSAKEEMKQFATSVALSVCSPVIIVGMLVMETVSVTRKTLGRRKVHPMETLPIISVP